MQIGLSSRIGCALEHRPLEWRLFWRRWVIGIDGGVLAPGVSSP
jgi:hypothetical protein